MFSAVNTHNANLMLEPQESAVLHVTTLHDEQCLKFLRNGKVFSVMAT